MSRYAPRIFARTKLGINPSEIPQGLRNTQHGAAPSVRKLLNSQDAAPAFHSIFLEGDVSFQRGVEALPENSLKS
ncbi:hypothetical protein CEXT_400981 [Caerostris extrusa]|uniref:Uncharacterized protein n=1 Tax=Caerostris extrusa TaxID=172846 RepID=A0AAV4UVA4_CAEEX|nr:hypothetical protein CEXT_400981 [Caerostris extrusa]